MKNWSWMWRGGLMTKVTKAFALWHTAWLDVDPGRVSEMKHSL